MERVTLAADAGVEDNADTSSVREVGDQTFFGGFLFKRWSDVCSQSTAFKACKGVARCESEQSCPSVLGLCPLSCV